MPTSRASCACERPSSCLFRLMRMPIGARIVPPVRTCLYIVILLAVYKFTKKCNKSKCVLPVLYFSHLLTPDKLVLWRRSHDKVSHQQAWPAERGWRRAGNPFDAVFLHQEGVGGGLLQRS